METREHIAETDGKRLPVQAHHDDAPTAPKVRILLIEDNDDLAHLIARTLEPRTRWTLARAATVDDAKPHLNGDRYDIIILDHQLPDGTGLEILSIIRANAPQTPILYLTGHGSEDIALRALGLGATDYMQKSGTLLEDLPARLDELLGRTSDLARAARVVPQQAARLIRAANRTPQIIPPPSIDAQRLAHIVDHFVHNDVLGAAIFDGAGTPIAALLPEGMDAHVLGACVLQLHAQAGLTARLLHQEPRAHNFTLEIDGAALAMTSIRGHSLAAVLVTNETTTPGALQRLAELTARIQE